MATVIDKNQAMIDFLQTCETIADNPLFFNFGDVTENAHQAITNSDDVALQKPFVDGSVLKRYTFSVDSFKSVAYNPLATATDDATSIEYTLQDENIADLKEVQTVLDWVNTQNDSSNFPNFGTNCIIEQMKTTTDRPQLMGVDTTLTPPMAIYRIAIEIDYIDLTKKLWN